MAVTSPAAVGRQRWPWRTIAFSLLAALFGLQALAIGALVFLPTPWVPPQPLPDRDVALARWHYAQGAVGVGLLTGVLLLVALWRPERKPALLQVAALTLVAGVVNAALQWRSMGFDPAAWVNLGLLGLLLAAYPAPRALRSLAGEGPWSAPLLALAVLAGLVLAPDAWRNLRWQLAGSGDEQIMRNYWVSAIMFDAVLFLAGLLVARKRPGWRTLGVLLGLAYLYLGAAALALPDVRGSWGVAGGAAAALGGLAWLGVTTWEARRGARSASAAPRYVPTSPA